MKLRQIAHVRTGDKGNTCNICVIPYHESDYLFLKERLSAAIVKDFYKEICKGAVTRFEVDSISALNFVLKGSLGGGVTMSLATDKHGKTLGMALLELDLS